MAEIEFMNLDVEILQEVLEDLPGDYSIQVEIAPGLNIPVMMYDIDDDSKELVFKPGDLNDNRFLKDRLECPICGYLAKVLSETETEIECYCANCGMDIVVNKND